MTTDKITVPTPSTLDLGLDPRPCGFCLAVFQPTRSWQRFCPKSKCAGRARVARCRARKLEAQLIEWEKKLQPLYRCQERHRRCTIKEEELRKLVEREVGYANPTQDTEAEDSQKGTEALP